MSDERAFRSLPTHECEMLVLHSADRFFLEDFALEPLVMSDLWMWGITPPEKHQREKEERVSQVWYKQDVVAINRIARFARLFDIFPAAYDTEHMLRERKLRLQV